MKRILRWLVPKEKEFFDVLAEQSQNVFNMANELKAFLHNYEKFERSERKAGAQSISRLENDMDELTKRAMHKLDKSYSTPIDKEDIQKIALLLEEISDLINATASRYIILSIERVDDYAIKMANLLHLILDELNKSILKLKKLKYAKEDCIKIHDIENQADEIFDDALSDLFHYYKNPMDVMKYRDIYEFLEKAINKCRDVAGVIERVVMKHS